MGETMERIEIMASCGGFPKPEDSGLQYVGQLHAGSNQHFVCHVGRSCTVPQNDIMEPPKRSDEHWHCHPSDRVLPMITFM